MSLFREESDLPIKMDFQWPVCLQIVPTRVCDSEKLRFVITRPSVWGKPVAAEIETKSPVDQQN